METFLTYLDIENIALSIGGYKLSCIEFVGTLFGLISVYLATRASIHTWTTGLINVVCFFVIFYQVQLYADMLLQTFFFVVSLLGMVRWNSKSVNNRRAITRLESRKTRWFVVGIVVCSLILSVFTAKLHVFLPDLFPQEAAYPVADAFTTVMSIVATFGLMNRILESWLLWIIVDVISIYLYYQKGILFISLEYCVFLSLATAGWIAWRRSLS